jgi:hypothetical protein
MMKRALLVTCVLGAAVALADPALKNRAPPPPSPPKELDALKPYLKAWTCNGVNAAGDPVGASITFQRELDGFWASLKLEQPKTRSAPAFTGFAMFGIDPTAKTWTMEGWDSWGGTLHLHAPSITATSMVFEGDSTDLGKTSKTKFTIGLPGKGKSLTFVAEIGGTKTVDQTCKGGFDASELLATMTDLKDKMCACKDKACVDKVDEESNKMMAAMAKSAGGSKERPTEEMIKKFTEVGIASMECKMKASGMANP